MDVGLPKDTGAEENDLPVVKTLKKVDRGVAQVELYVMAIGLVALVVLGAYRALHHSSKRWGEGNDIIDRGWRAFNGILFEAPGWTTPTVQVLVFVVGLLGLALAAQSERMIAIDVIVRSFRPKIRLVVRIISYLFTIFILYLFIKAALHFRATVLESEKSADGKLISHYQASLLYPITSVLVIFHLGLRIVCDVIALATGRIPPEPKPKTDTGDGGDGETSDTVEAAR